MQKPTKRGVADPTREVLGKMATPIDIILATPQEPTRQEEATSTPREGSVPTPIASDAANASLATSAAAASGAVGSATPSSSTPNQPDVIDTSKLKSKVWEHMTKKMIGGKIRAECKYCKNNYAASASSDESNRRRGRVVGSMLCY